MLPALPLSLLAARADVPEAAKGDPWIVLLGGGYMFFFTARFVVQWIVSEWRKKSVMPESFWWFSIAGSFLLILYVIYIHARYALPRAAVVPLILPPVAGLVPYVRNLMLIHRAKGRGGADPPAPAAPP